MRVSYKVVLISSAIVFITFTLFSWQQYTSVKTALYEKAASNVAETSKVIANQIANWLNGKLDLIDMASQSIDNNHTSNNIQSIFDQPILADNFILIFGGLATDGKPITNDPSWAPDNWDARKRPWYGAAQNNNQAVLTAPYEDASTKEVLISAVAKLNDKGVFKGAFGGDLSLKVIAGAINQINFGDTGYAFLISDQGDIISHPNNEFNGQSIGQLFTTVTPSISPQLQEIELDGNAVLTSFQPLTNLRGSKWHIGVVLDREKVLKEASDFGVAAVIGAFLSILFTAFALYFTIAKLFKPLDQLQHSIVDINSGDGDLTKRLQTSSNDEFGKVSLDFNSFIEHLQEIIVDVKSIAGEIGKSTDLNATAAANTADGLQKQLNELDMLSAAITQMSYSAQDVAENAQKAASAAQTADVAAGEGNSIVAKTFTSLGSLVDDMDATVITVNQLEEYSSNIESVLTSITSIAQQTNLLALNAAIEAARAGDKGRGFAVVADEVRALAARTQLSTDETSTIIEQLQEGVQDAVRRIAHSRQLATDTSVDAEKADQILNDIKSAISEINNLTVQIAAAAEEQSTTSEEINKNATAIRDISQNVANQAQEQSQLSSTMAQSTQQQNEVLDQFKV